ncbi:MAG: GNAT family N-acetyltransferase [Herminiimonas sp.]|nr:GNAT family N-acetyltransferase [Herminiimonas sp.]
MAWQWRAFDDLSGADLYEALKLRQAVFVIEQNCIFPDLDGADQESFHLLGWLGHGAQRTLVAYLRCLPAGVKFVECSIGRVVSSPAARGTGIGKQLVEEGLRRTMALFPGQAIRIGAQQRLERFYADFGFVTDSAPYDEDDILHVEMLRPGDAAPVAAAIG